MSREWKRGDVAVLPYNKGLGIVDSEGGIFYVGGYAMPDSMTVRMARPAVVIDPENSKAMSLLAAMILQHDYQPGDNPADLADVFREFADPKPPKPEEPSGLGAVVEDGKGDTWVRVGSDGVWAASTPDRVATQWDSIDAVRVLSEGLS